MKKESWILKLMNIRPEEARAVFLLMCFSFFSGLTLTFYFTASNAIFLKHFQPSMIPVSFMASGLLIYLAWRGFSQIDRRLTFSVQVSAKFLFIFATVLAISIGVWKFPESSWLIFMMYTWVRIVVYILLVNFWGTAGKLFNIRQGKRIFGLIGIGEVVSIIIGYFSIPLILHFLKASDLLFLASVSLLICLLLVFFILRVFREQLQATVSRKTEASKEINREWRYLNLIRKPYFIYISLMALLPIFGYLFVDFLFLAQTKKEFANNSETIASFLGIFLGFVAIVELGLKMVSGRFLNKYGLKPSLISVPLIMLVSILMAAIFGSVYGAVGMFFAFIALARLFERSVRGAVYEPAFQLLYQPVPTELRLTFQNQIEGIPKAMGTLITGAIIFIFSTFTSFSLVSFNWLFCIALAAWIWVAFRMYDEYRNMLKDKLSELKTESSHENAKMAEVIRQAMISTRPERFESIFDIMRTAEPVAAEQALVTSLQEASPELQVKILKALTDQQSIGAIAYLETQFLPAIKDLPVAGTGVSALEQLKQAEKFSFEFLSELARSGETEERLQAARLLGSSARYNAFKLLLNLMKDNDLQVRNAAIISAGKLRRVELWPSLIDHLANPETARAAHLAILRIGDPILTDLDIFFEKISVNNDVRLEIISIYTALASQRCIKLLRQKMNHPDHEVRFRVMFALSSLGYHANASEISFIKECIEETVEYIVWVLAALNDLSGLTGGHDLQVSLLTELEEKKEEMFLLLSLLYDSKTIGHIREYIESKDTTARVYALEISDMTISDEIKELFFPVFEDVSVHERLSKLQIRFPQEALTQPGRLIDIINKGYTQANRMTKAYAITLLGRSTEVPADTANQLFAANLVHPDPLLSEISAWTLYNLDRNYYIDTMVRFEKRWDTPVPALAEKIRTREKGLALLLFEQVTMMKNHELFAAVSDRLIIRFLLLHEGVLRPCERDDQTGRKNSAQVIITGHDGKAWCIPAPALHDFLNDSPEFTERFFRYLNTTTAN